MNTILDKYKTLGENDILVACGPKSTKILGLDVECMFCDKEVFITDSTRENIKQQNPDVKEEHIKICCTPCILQIKKEIRQDSTMTPLTVAPMGEAQIQEIMKSLNLSREEVIKRTEKITQMLEGGFLDDFLKKNF